MPKHAETCQKLYEEGGAAAVYDYANQKNITEWEYCSSCDADTPRENGVCLVCGQ